MSRAKPHNIEDYPHSLVIPTRWADNDVYGHINNSVYYFYFDTVVNRFLIDEGLLEVGKSEVAEAGVHHRRAGGAAPPRLEARQPARRGLAAGGHGHRRHARDQHPGAAARDVAVGVVAEPLLARPEDVAGACAREG